MHRSYFIFAQIFIDRSSFIEKDAAAAALQCDQIWRNFAILAKSSKSWAIFSGFIYYLGKFWTVMVKFCVPLGKFSLMRKAKC